MARLPRWWPWRTTDRTVELEARLAARDAEVARLRATVNELRTKLRGERAHTRDHQQVVVQRDYLANELERERAQRAIAEQAHRDADREG